MNWKTPKKVIFGHCKLLHTPSKDGMAAHMRARALATLYIYIYIYIYIKILNCHKIHLIITTDVKVKKKQPKPCFKYFKFKGNMVILLCYKVQFQKILYKADEWRAIYGPSILVLIANLFPSSCMGAANLSAWNATCNSQDISIKRKVWQFSWYL